MGFFDSDAKDMLEIYLLETKQLISQLNEILLETEKNGVFTQEDINTIFRVMHTMKSSSAMMGLEELSSAAHKLEDLFSVFRDRGEEIQNPGAELFDLLFDACDLVEREREAMKEDSYAPEDGSNIIERADAYLRKVAQVPDEENEEEISEKSEKDAILEQFLQREGVTVKVLFEENCNMENIRAYMLLRQITPLCTQVTSYPDNLEKNQEAAGIVAQDGVYFQFESPDRDKVLEMLSRGLFVKDCEILENIAAHVEDEPEQENSEDEEHKADETAECQNTPPVENKELEYLDVRTDRLDKLQNQVTELMMQMIILENQLTEKGLEEIKEGTAHQISRLTSEIERTVMETRMVRVSRMIPKLRRILRDICRSQGKEAELIVTCEDMEADKSVIEYVSEVLMHILRNAVDHGIEMPQERREAGKEEKGKIEFTASSTVGELVVCIKDDGCGLDPKKILAKAKAQGILKKPEQEYDIQEVWELILEPGFTTNEQVTEYSGRGVGLDVVKKVLEGAGGRLYVQSELGKGSTFKIVMPLNLATVECIRFRAGDYRFSLPARYVFGFLSYSDYRDEIQDINGRDYILHENRMIPFINIRKFYGDDGDIPETAIIIYVKSTEQEGCILAESMYEQKRIVIKQLPTMFGVDFRRKTAINGCSIMGNGKISASLDIETLITKYVKEGRYLAD